MVTTIERYTPLAPLLPREPLAAVVSTFYERVYAHPWIGRFFAGVDPRIQALNLVLFIESSWEDRAYPKRQERYLWCQHAHVFITGPLFDLRQALFADALRHHGHGDAIVEAFRHFDERWRPHVVKASIGECSDMISAIVSFDPPPAPGVEGDGRAQGSPS